MPKPHYLEVRVSAMRPRGKDESCDEVCVGSHLIVIEHRTCDCAGTCRR